MDPGCETFAASHSVHAQDPPPPHPHRSTGGAAQWASVPPTLLRHRRGSSAAGVGRVVTRRPHPALARPPATPSTCEKICLGNRHRTGRRTHTHVPAGPRASKQSVGEAFVLAITQPSVKTLITTVERDDTQLWRGRRRFFYFYFLKRGAAVTTQEDPREGLFFLCFLFFLF